MKKESLQLNIIFAIHTIGVLAVAFGYLPRWFILPLAGVALLFCLFTNLENATLFFIRSIPFLVALPFTSSFDSLSFGRVLAVVIFLRWLVQGRKIKSFFVFKQRPVYLTTLALLSLALLSVLVAPSATLAIKRIIYLVNLSLIGIVVYDLVTQNAEFTKRVVKNIAIPAILVALFGLWQLITTYLMDIFQFFAFWGNGVERNMFGNAWADIALKANTWFAYFGDQLSLRMFSIFPDSHSFPMFLVFALPAVLALALAKVAEKTSLREMFKTRGRLLVLAVPLLFLDIILSGTRGMWAAGAGSILMVLFWLYFFRKQGITTHKKAVFKYLSSYLAVFFLLFFVAYPIFASPQFLVSKLDAGLLGKRIHSIINLGETSNSRRIEIWRDSVKSIIRRPLLGVGISNFPMVVGEELVKVKAGSSAHNLYLHVAAEIGIPALLLTLYWFWLLLKSCYRRFREESDPLLLVYFGASLIFIVWNLFYLLTDVAIFDERVFLIFTINIGLILANKKEDIYIAAV